MTTVARARRLIRTSRAGLPGNLLAVRSFDHGMALFFESESDEPADRWFIVDDQDTRHLTPPGLSLDRIPGSSGPSLS